MRSLHVLEAACSASSRSRTSGVGTLAAQIEAGKCKLEGDTAAFEKLRSVLVQFDPFFEIIPGTKAGESPESNPFQQDDLAITGE